jgi:hypothetical protein
VKINLNVVAGIVVIGVMYAILTGLGVDVNAVIMAKIFR